MSVSARDLLPETNALDQSNEMTMTEEFSPDLIALLGSRLCHDLISPLGAIGNGVELMAMSGQGMSPELQLIAESVNAANARLKFFRVAFGQASTDQRLGASEVKGVLAEIGSTGRVQYNWMLEGDQSRRVVKLCFLAALCMETAMPWGGTITVSEVGGAIVLAADTKKTKYDATLWSVIGGASAEIAPAHVQFALLPREAAKIGRTIAFEIDETRLAVSF